MAIQIKYDSEFSFIFPKAYAKIENIRINIEDELFRIEIRYFATKEARQIDTSLGIGKEIIEVKFSDIGKIKNFDKNSIKTLCYNYIKTLDQFKGGVDLL